MKSKKKFDYFIRRDRKIILKTYFTCNLKQPCHLHNCYDYEDPSNTGYVFIYFYFILTILAKSLLYFVFYKAYNFFTSLLFYICFHAFLNYFIFFTYSHEEIFYSGSITNFYIYKKHKIKMFVFHFGL